MLIDRIREYLRGEADYDHRALLRETLEAFDALGHMPAALAAHRGEVHSTEDDYQHFLAYSGLKHSPWLKYAYYHGADVGLDKPEPPEGGGLSSPGPPLPARRDTATDYGFPCAYPPQAQAGAGDANVYAYLIAMLAFEQRNAPPYPRVGDWVVELTSLRENAGKAKHWLYAIGELVSIDDEAENNYTIRLPSGQLQKWENALMQWIHGPGLTAALEAK